MRGDNPEISRAQTSSSQNKWGVAAGGLALVAVLFAWVVLANLTWLLFLPLLAIVFVPVFRQTRRLMARASRANMTLALPALAAVVVAAPFALALIAPVDLVNRLDLANPRPIKARVLNVERKEDSYGRGTRKFHYYALKLDEAGREIVLRGPEEQPRFGIGETIAVCGYRGLLGLPVYGLPPCTRTLQLE